MSQVNVEAHNRAIEAFHRRDLDTMLALADEDVVVESRIGLSLGAAAFVRGRRLGRRAVAFPGPRKGKPDGDGSRCRDGLDGAR